MRRMFSNLSRLLNKTQYSSDITSKVRIQRSTPDIRFVEQTEQKICRIRDCLKEKQQKREKSE